MTVSTAGNKSAPMKRELVWIEGRIRQPGTIVISGWYTVFDLNGRFDLILGKDWMEANPHIINHGKNNISLLARTYFRMCGNEMQESANNRWN